MPELGRWRHRRHDCGADARDPPLGLCPVQNGGGVGFAQRRRRPLLLPAQAIPEVAAGEIGSATSELQSLMRISYAVFCLKKTHIDPTKKDDTNTDTTRSKYTAHLLLHTHITRYRT